MNLVRKIQISCIFSKYKEKNCIFISTGVFNYYYYSLCAAQVTLFTNYRNILPTKIYAYFFRKGFKSIVQILKFNLVKEKKCIG